MAEDLGKKNRDFLKKFVSKDIIRKKGAYWLEEVKTEDPDEWKELSPPPKKTKKDNKKSVSKKKKNKVRHIPIPNLYRNYQEKAYQKPFGGSQTKAISSIVIPPPLVKSKKNKPSIVIPFRVKSKKKKRKKKTKKPESCKYCKKRFKTREEKEEHESDHLLREKRAKSHRVYKLIKDKIKELPRLEKNVIIEKLTEIGERIEGLYNEDKLTTKHYENLAEETMNLYFDITVD